MPAYNFQGRFADDVEVGRKRQTIRQKRKRRTKKGDPLYLFTGMRTPHCRKLRDTTCRRVRPIQIGKNVIRVDGQSIKTNSAAAGRFARLDGFSGSAEMINWFRKTYGPRFYGVVIYW